MAGSWKFHGVTLGVRDLEVEVKGTYYPGTPALLQGHPDTWEPEDPEEVDLEGYRVVEPSPDDPVEMPTRQEVVRACYRVLPVLMREQEAWR